MPYGDFRPSMQLRSQLPAFKPSKPRAKKKPKKGRKRRRYRPSAINREIYQAFDAAIERKGEDFPPVHESQRIS